MLCQVVILILIFLYENVPCTDPARIPLQGVMKQEDYIHWKVNSKKKIHNTIGSTCILIFATFNILPFSYGNISYKIWPELY